MVRSSPSSYRTDQVGGDEDTLAREAALVVGRDLDEGVPICIHSDGRV